ncbi:hypothetical protein IJJ53_03780 [Candidatus Saccharibacteria bacterium]|nr:hypothetical protein [Candidatus Saccharibacteria bacterium]
MDRQEYLNQISATNQPTKSPKSGIFASKFFWVGVIGVAAFILIMIIGSALGGGGTSAKDKLYALILHINNTSELIGEYQPNVKSSELRSHSASLSSILANTNKGLNDYATSKYNFKEKDIPKKITEEETTAKDELQSELFEAKINGILDRVYAHKMAYEISLITTRESQLLKSANNDDLKEALTASYNSLNNLYSKFNDFSETN